MEIVVAYYHNTEFENLISRFNNATIRIYDKSQQYKHTNYKNVTVLENQGREGDTYLYHIIENYDKLEEYTLFIQDDTENHVENYDDFIAETEDVINSNIPYFQYDTLWRKNLDIHTNLIVKGYNKLFDEDIINTEENIRNTRALYLGNILKEPDYHFLNEYRKNKPHKFAIEHICKRFNIVLPEAYLSPHSAFFIVHKSQIHKRTKEFYIELRNWLLEADINIFVLEMIWILIFGE
jgi:hypothetical protein